MIFEPIIVITLECMPNGVYVWSQDVNKEKWSVVRNEDTVTVEVHSTHSVETT